MRKISRRYRSLTEYLFSSLLEIYDHARILIDHYTTKTARLFVGDFSALVDSPINASIVENMWRVVETKKVAPRAIGAFFGARHFAEIPTVQLSARLFSAYKESLRSKPMPEPTSKSARKRLSGFLSDIQHAATYAPYCDGYFTDKAMAKLMSGQRVSVERDFGCKVFSVESMDDFLGWLETLKSLMTPEHADDLAWAYPKRFFHKN